MDQRRFSKPQKTSLARALVGAFAAVSASGALAATNYLIATDISNPLSWSEQEINVDGANVINRQGTWLVDDSNESLDFGYGLYIGNAGTGSLDITVTPAASYSYLYIEPSEFDPNLPPLTPNWDPSFRVGDAGGTGTLTIELQELPEDEYSETRLVTDSIGLGVGLGSGSNGTVSIFGTGKNSNQSLDQSPKETLIYSAHPAHRSPCL